MVNDSILYFKACRKYVDNTAYGLVSPDEVRVGSKYRIMSDISGFPLYGDYHRVQGMTILDGMCKDLGKVVTIKYIDYDNDFGYVVRLKDNIFWWPLSILEPL